MISDRYIETFTAGQTRIEAALNNYHDDDLAARGDEHRDRREVTR